MSGPILLESDGVPERPKVLCACGARVYLIPARSLEPGAMRLAFHPEGGRRRAYGWRGTRAGRNAISPHRDAAICGGQWL